MVRRPASRPAPAVPRWGEAPRHPRRENRRFLRPPLHIWRKSRLRPPNQLILLQIQFPPDFPPPAKTPAMFIVSDFPGNLAAVTGVSGLGRL